MASTTLRSADVGSTRQHFEKAGRFSLMLRSGQLCRRRFPTRQATAANWLSDDEIPQTRTCKCSWRARRTQVSLRHDPRGTAQSVSALTVDDLKRYHSR